MLRDLLSPLFHKVDWIIEELCGLCGVCPRRLQEEKDHFERLKIRLVAPFKWTRAKDRVGELRAGLKLVRLDFANQLAAVTLSVNSASLPLADLQNRLPQRYAYITLDCDKSTDNLILQARYFQSDSGIQDVYN